MTSVILCGGSGTRLWPLSRTMKPKQFLELFNSKSLFELCAARNAKMCENLIIVANSEHYFLAKDQLGGVLGPASASASDSAKNARFILEPFGRNTAGAIALACLAVGEEEVVLVVPSDHLIKNEAAYSYAVRAASELIAKNKDALITFGVRPDRVETGYGYIKFRAPNIVEKFIEKPDFERACEFVKSGEYLWNSGMFAFRAGAFLSELGRINEGLFAAAQNAWQNAQILGDYTRINASDMEQIEDISIDYAVMEHSKKVAVVPCEANWSDVGSFESLADEFSGDLAESEVGKNGENGENTRNAGNVAFARFEQVGSKNNFVISNNPKKLIAALDIENLMIIDTTDALLVGAKSSSQKVKEIYQKIKKDPKLATYHLKTHRPWGSYTVLEDQSGYKIKRIEVLPNKRLSLQAHQHRSEHWIVLSGTASVEAGGEVRLVAPNESTFIKIGQKHRLSNEGKIPVVLIEVQVGEYTEEDDIRRFEDDFARVDGGG